MPAPHIERARPDATAYASSRVKSLTRDNISESVRTAMPTSKLFILFLILVRDQEVGGSNPLAPTNYPSLFH